jgi:glycosyltransferase involved in cell wall biosynthesis
METSLKISIITVVRNGEQHIEQTINSIISQTYTNIEYIIIDGNSKDRTVEIIKKYNQYLTYWISEPDKGIFDAMNKGVQAATGEWIVFINADDFLVNNDIVSQVVPYLLNSNSLINYGQILYIEADESETLHGFEWNKIKQKFRYFGMVIPHQATFHSKQLFDNRQFNTKLKVAADYDLLLSYLSKNDAEYLPMIISKMRGGGFSSTVSPLKIIEENTKAQMANSRNSVFFVLRISVNAALFLIYFYLSSFFGTNIKSRIVTKLKIFFN